MAAWFDTLKSLVTGLGTAEKDKSISMAFTMRSISDAELNAMYRCDWLSRKIIDIIPNDMTRVWRSWKADQAQIEAIEEVEKHPLISVRSKVNEAMRKARLLRGAAIYMAIGTDDPSDPLDVTKIKKGSLKYLNVISRSELSWGEIDYDVTSEFYREPRYYDVRGANGSTVRIHPSRMIRFCGAPILDPSSDADGWGDSILQVVYDAVQNSGSVQGHIAGMIPESKVDVIYIPGLSSLLADPRSTQLLTSRFAYANTIKSNFNMVLLDGSGEDGAVGERWEQKQLSFQNLTEIAQLYLQIASGAADIPITRLLGQSPAGMNSTGESDIRNYYDNLSSQQENSLSKTLARLDEVIIRSALGDRPKEIYYEWVSLWGLSETERATNFKMKADAARAIAGSGGLSPPLITIEALSDAFTNMLIEDGSLPGLEAAIKEYGKLSEQEDDEDDVAASATPRPLVEGEEEEEGSNVVPIRKAAGAEDAEPRTLYVRRDVVNVDDFKAWARSQGIADLRDGLHVTIVYSRTPIDWIKAGNASDWGERDGRLIIPAGGPRVVEPLGEMTAVLLFSSSTLCWRHEEIVRAGASHGYAEYIPHISLTKSEVDLASIEPYRGEIVLGPEIFEEVKEG
jgi:phage-related protein (TIGR01555 family)